jgi:hypothetical protein
MFEIYDKWNGKNFIWYKNGKVYEFIKCSGRMYLVRLSLKLWLIPYGEALREWKDFYFGTN